MPKTEFAQLLDEISKRQEMIKAYLAEDRNRITFDFKHLEDAVYSYVNAGGKGLRAAVLMFCCGAVGGDEKTAIPAAAAIELYHTFTLVHDDIIDRDETRRGIPTVHAGFQKLGQEELGFDVETAQHYGTALAILAGDLQQGWAASLLPDLYTQHGLPPELALNLIRELFLKTQMALINGETLDVLQARTPVEQLNEKAVLDMLRQKTGSLYEFAGRAGAAIGLRQPDLHHPMVESIAIFAAKCGLAFQIQDDILGITGNEEKLGKPIGSDIREGKRTIILLHSLPNMELAQQEFTLNVLGSQDATPSDIQEVISLLKSTGGIAYAEELANTIIKEALLNLKKLPKSPYKTFLEAWVSFIIERSW
jgi:geranylgeranyl diphosphate synthase, type I